MKTNKIDKTLLQKVTSEQNKENKIECIVYLHKYYQTKNYFLKKYKQENVIEFPFINALGIQLKSNEILSFNNLSMVNYVTTNSKVKKQTYISKKVMNFKNLESELKTYKSSNVAVIDTGIANHIDFLVPENRILFFKDFINNKQKNYDDNGHGTFVSGIIAGSGVASGKYKGFSPFSKLISLKALDKKGETNIYTILQAMQWIYDNHKKFNIRVVCMSFGSLATEKNDPLSLGAEALWRKGIVVVASAGNSGPEKETIKSPAINRNIISVGALDDKRNSENKIYEVANFSSRGPAFGTEKPDLITSGVDIISTNNNGKDFYTTMSGTSASAPIIAGICARILGKYPYATPKEIKQYILLNCKKIVNNKNIEGEGFIFFE